MPGLAVVYVCSMCILSHNLNAVGAAEVNCCDLACIVFHLKWSRFVGLLLNCTCSIHVNHWKNPQSVCVYMNSVHGIFRVLYMCIHVYDPFSDSLHYLTGHLRWFLSTLEIQSLPRQIYGWAIRVRVCFLFACLLCTHLFSMYSICTCTVHACVMMIKVYLFQWNTYCCRCMYMYFSLHIHM